MTARKTRCLTWGEYRPTGSEFIYQNGRRCGIVDYGSFVTVCGKLDDDPRDTGGLDHDKARPIGVCRACWKRYRTEMQRPEAKP